MTTTRLFKDRADAALVLADRLSAYRGAHPLVLAIPRGAVPMAQVIAQALDGEFDVVLVHKLGAPFSEEFAVGSVDESGTVYRLPHAARAGADDAYIEQEAARQLDVLRRRRERYTPLRPPIDRAFDDLIRQYFVAFSRPQDVLLLVGVCDPKTKQPKMNIPNMALGWSRYDGSSAGARWPLVPTIVNL